MAVLGRIRPGDLVQCDVKGRLFLAESRGPGSARGTLKIAPPYPGAKALSWTQVTARQVKKHWRLVQS